MKDTHENEDTFIPLATAMANVVRWLSTAHHHAGKRDHEQDENRETESENGIFAPGTRVVAGADD